MTVQHVHTFIVSWFLHIVGYISTLVQIKGMVMMFKVPRKCIFPFMTTLITPFANLSLMRKTKLLCDN